MVRKVVIISIMALVIAGMASSGYSASCGTCAKPCAKPCVTPAPCNESEDCGDNNAMKKLGRGVANVITCPFEIPNQISRINNSDGPYAAFTYGVVKGLVMFVYRGVIGVYETISFPVPFPKCYKPMLTEPEFFFETESY